MALPAFIEAAVAAVQEICACLRTTPQDVLHKRYSQGAGGDVSIGADLLCESILYAHLAPFGILDTEESGLIESPESFLHNPFLPKAPIVPRERNNIIIDPLDGSDNFCSHIPYYGTSLAYTDANGEILAALVANYCTGDIFFRDSAYENGAAFMLCGGALLPYTKTEHTPKAGIFESAFKHGKLATMLHKNGFKARSLGASAVSLAYTRMVSFVVYKGRLRKYDIQEGLFLCLDALLYRDKQILLLSYNREIFDQVCTLLKES
ncbi:MAG: hypothetical protein K2N54_04975 [Helicobacter sp.]|nr:hypothetical protein [Helicobacter sp.]